MKSGESSFSSVFWQRVCEKESLLARRDLVTKSGNTHLSWSVSSSSQPELNSRPLPASPSLLWITSHHLLHGKLQQNGFSSSSPKFSHCFKHQLFLRNHTSIGTPGEEQTDLSGQCCCLPSPTIRGICSVP